MSRSRILNAGPGSLAAYFVVLVALGGSSTLAGPPATGPLKRLESNPRYFTDGSDKAVLLTGSHTCGNFQDNGHRHPRSNDPPRDVRLRRLPRLPRRPPPQLLPTLALGGPEVDRRAAPGDDQVLSASPLEAYRPRAPGVDGKLRFDLSAYDPDYFDRLRDRITAPRDRGIYVSIMLFEGWELQFTDAWKYHPFHGPNNVNGIDADPEGRGLLYNQLRDDEMGRRVLALQEAYLRKVVDTVNDLDNVLYEACNEAGADSKAWQYHVIDFIHTTESRMPKRHPVGMTFMYPGGTNRMLIDSPADWISPNQGSPDADYRFNPSAKELGKVIVNDTDHLWGHTGGDSVWVWKEFPSRAERAVHGGTLAQPHLARLGARRHGPDATLRRAPQPRPHASRASPGPDRLHPCRTRSPIPRLPGRRPGRVLDRPHRHERHLQRGVVRPHERQDHPLPTPSTVRFPAHLPPPPSPAPPS